MDRLEAHRICPICGGDNGCIIGNKDCWCRDFDFPEGLIEMVPEDKRGQVCICRQCAQTYLREKEQGK